MTLVSLKTHALLALMTNLLIHYTQIWTHYIYDLCESVKRILSISCMVKFKSKETHGRAVKKLFHDQKDTLAKDREPRMF